MDKVAIYCRLSDEDRDKVNGFDESESIQNQKTLLTKYAIEKGLAIYKIYSDDDYSGLDSERPEFNCMIEDAKMKRFNIVICKHQSRFTRDMELIEKYLHNKFIEWGIRFISITDNVDTLDKGNKKSRQINGLVNEWYCEDISEAIRATFKVKREDGKFIGSFATYGYKKDPDDKNKLIIDEYSANVITDIFNWYLEGYGTQHIAYILNEKRISNPTKYKKDNGFKFKNSSQTDGYGLWNKTTIRRILRNEMYIGNMVQAKRKKVSYKSKKIIGTQKHDWIIVENTHEPIIDIRIFNAVQKRLNSNVRSSGEGKAHVFATKVKCMDCKSTMHKVTSINGYMYLRCKLYANDPKKELCSSHSIRLDQLQEVVTIKIKNYINALCNDKNLACRLEQETEINTKIASVKNELHKLKNTIEDKSRLIKNLYIDKAKGIILEEQFVELNNTFITEKEKLLQRQSVLNKEIEEINSKAKNLDKWTDVVKKYKDFKELTNTMVNELIDFIEIGEKDKLTKKQWIKIHWLF